MSSNGKGSRQSAHEILKPRAEWIVKRKAEAARTGDSNMSQMHFARQGKITEEMAFVAEREKIPVGLIRDEIAAGRLIIPANINHPSWSRWASGWRPSARSTPISATPR